MLYQENYFVVNVKLDFVVDRLTVLMVKMNDLVRLHEAMQEKLKTASYSEQIQVLTVVPNKWSRMYCSKYFNIFECLAGTSHEINKVGRILAKPAPKKRKNYNH